MPTGSRVHLVHELPNDEKVEVLAAHPAIGQRSGLSERSAVEQGADADPGVLTELAHLNAEYEARHGFRFVVFVNRRPKAEILEVLRDADRPADGAGARDGPGRARRDRSRSLGTRMTLALLDPYVTDWLNLLLRWLHVIAAMAWIGTSFYFVLLDSSLRPPKDPQDVKDGVGGDLWEVHGGGFYHVKKYRVAPPTLPEHLAWFKWEAYTTWLSGFGLMVVLYYFEARAQLIDPTVADLTPAQAVGISVGLLAAAWLVYDGLCRALIAHEGALAASIVGLTAAATWACSELFAPRAAFLQVGAMLGTIMAGNVLFNIIPAHWELIRAKQQGREPDQQPAIVAKQRSVHNNFLTLPVLLTMLAGHVAFLYEVERPWLVLFALMLLGAWARLFFNLRHTGRTIWTIPAVGIAAVVVLAVARRA